ncbi:MAG: hypothetical protein Q8Q31_05500 [Nanoarchaeota archaeon]|nr:hypothetical protein [Nanoarchaeota archaeon]
MGKDTLHIGIDDSNHHSVPHEEEYIVAVASLNSLDALPTPRIGGRRRRELGDITRLIEDQDLYYRCTSLPQESEMNPSLRQEIPGNLAYAAPFLVKSLVSLIKKSLEKLDKDSLKIQLHLDGLHHKREKDYLVGKVEEEHPGMEITLAVYPKNKSGFKYPLILDIADLYASTMFRAFTGTKVDSERGKAIKAIMHPHFIATPRRHY